MARILVLVLAAVNLLYWSWSAWIKEEDPHLLAPAAGASTPQAVASPAPCTTIGPFEDEVRSMEVEQLLRDMQLAPSRRSITQDVHEGWWVYLDNADEPAQARALRTILAAGLRDAFALPDGRLYITRGLIALANDKAELASVLAHEMGHVIARHAAIREEQARQVAIIGHVVSDVLSDPQVGALALAKSKLTLAAFSRAQEFEADGIGVGISARAGFDPYGASRFLSDMQRNADLKASDGAGPRGIDFLSSHPATPERVKNALANARQFSGPGRGERDHTD